MTKHGWWKVNFEINLDGKKVYFKDLSEATQEHILESIKRGCRQGEAAEDSENTDMIGGHYVDVYDNGGETVDRYTIVVDEDIENCIGMSDNPCHPQGFNQYVGDVALVFLNTQKHLDEIPETIRKAVEARVKEL